MKGRAGATEPLHPSEPELQSHSARPALGVELLPGLIPHLDALVDAQLLALDAHVVEHDGRQVALAEAGQYHHHQLARVLGAGGDLDGSQSRGT